MTSVKTQEFKPLDEYKQYISEAQTGFWVVLTFFVIGAVLGMVFYKQIIGTVMGFFNLDNINVVLTSPYQFIDLSINSGFFVGIVFALPIFLYYLLRFVEPALKSEEYKLLVQLLPISVILFVIGFGFGVWVLQYVVDLFSAVSTNLAVSNIWDISGFMTQVVITGLSMALIFQMPILITALLRLKIVKHKAISSRRKEVYAGLLIVAAMLPPTDIFSLVILTCVPLFLFEITLLLNRKNIE